MPVVRPTRSPLVVVALLALLAPSPARAGWLSSVGKFFRQIGSDFKFAIDVVGDNLKSVATDINHGMLVAIDYVTGAGSKTAATSAGAAKRLSLPPEVQAKLQNCHVVAGKFQLTGKTYGESQKFGFKVDQPGEVNCRVDWQGAPSLAVILNGPGQVNAYDRIDGPSSLAFSFTVSPELARKGQLWYITVKDFSKSNLPSTGQLVALTPRTIGETIATASPDQRDRNSEQDIRRLDERVRTLETELRLEKEYSRRLAELLNQLRQRVNALDHKEPAGPKG